MLRKKFSGYPLKRFHLISKHAKKCLELRGKPPKLATNGILTKTLKSGENGENVKYIPLLLYCKCFFCN